MCALRTGGRLKGLRGGRPIKGTEILIAIKGTELLIGALDRDDQDVTARDPLAVS